MDFNCGTVIDGTESVAQAGARFFELILKTASGRQVEVRRVRLRRRRVRTVDHRRDHVTSQA
jgi:altronate dehydratase